MKFSLSIVTILSLVGAITAVPPPAGQPAGQEQKQKDPPLVPLTLANAPGEKETFRCGGNTYTGKDIYVAVQYGLSLYLAKQTRGRNKYPESFHSDDSKGLKLHFPPDCPADRSRFSFPLKRGGVPYNGGPWNRNQGDERVVYYYEDGEIDGKDHEDVNKKDDNGKGHNGKDPKDKDKDHKDHKDHNEKDHKGKNPNKAYYCGIITHKGAAPGGFHQC